MWKPLKLLYLARLILPLNYEKNAEKHFISFVLAVITILIIQREGLVNKNPWESSKLSSTSNKQQIVTYTINNSTDTNDPIIN